MPKKTIGFEYTIGDRVVIKAVTTMGYDEDNNRKPYKDEFTKPQRSIIVGAVRRRLGKYKKNSGRPSYTFSYFGEYEEYTPPELKVTGTILLYQCRCSMTSGIVDVAPEDISKEESNA